jgi:hypothetical protein
VTYGYTPTYSSPVYQGTYYSSITPIYQSPAIVVIQNPVRSPRPIVEPAPIEIPVVKDEVEEKPTEFKVEESWSIRIKIRCSGAAAKRIIITCR